MTVWTIGHSTLPAEQFTALLIVHGMQHLADVRSVPHSRRNPQFNSGALSASLAAARIGYTHHPGLGGLRQPRLDSINTGWQNDSFRGYADYMQTDAFERSLQELMETAGQRRVVILCAESVPWRCHRSLVADALAARAVNVQHILSASSVKPHSLTPFAQVNGERVTYPGLPVPTLR